MLWLANKYNYNLQGWCKLSVKAAEGKLWKYTQIQLALRTPPCCPFGPPYPCCLTLLTLLGFNTGGEKKNQEKQTNKKEVTSSNNSPQKATVSYYSASSFRLFDVAPPTESCFFHSLFLHTNKMLHVLYVAHPQLLFKAHLSQLTVLCSLYHFSNQYSYIIGTEAFLF